MATKAGRETILWKIPSSSEKFLKNSRMEHEIWGQKNSVILDRSSLNAQIEEGDHGKETEEVRERESRRRRDSCACGQGRVLTKCEWRYFSYPFHTYSKSTKNLSTWHSHPVITGWPFLLVSPAGICNVRVLLFWLTCSHLIEAKGSRKARSQFSRWTFPRG